MKVTVVCAHYLPQFGYIEVHLAKAFAEVGHEVCVVTSSAVPAYLVHLHPKIKPGQFKDGAICITRLKPILTVGQIAISKGVAQAVTRNIPDLIIVIGAGKYFPKAVYHLSIPVITLFGDNSQNHIEDSQINRLKTRLLFKLFKLPVYKLAIHKSHKLVAYTPESFCAAGRFLGQKERDFLATQKNFISLGFSQHQFYFDKQIRETTRRKFGFRNSDIVVITATRVVPQKQLESYIEHFVQCGARVRWLVVGGDDGTYAQSFAEKAQKALGDARFTMVPFCKREDLNALLCAADVAFYSVTAITVYEALGAGLPCILPPDRSLSHLIAMPELALSFEIADTRSIAAKVQAFSLFDEDGIHNPSFREKRTLLAREHFSWEGIAGRLIEMAR